MQILAEKTSKIFVKLIRALAYFFGFLLDKSGAGKLFYHKIKPCREGSIIGYFKKSNFFMYLIYSAYLFYFLESNKHLANSEFQKKFWDNYKGFFLQKDYEASHFLLFDEYFDKAIKKYQPKCCLELGCGAFIHTNRLSRLYANIQFIANDISEESEKVYKANFSNRDNISFLKGNILENKDILNNVDLVYSIWCLQYWDEKELSELLLTLRETRHRSILIICEIYQSKIPSFFTKSRDFRHDYLYYMKKFQYLIEDFKILRKPWGGEYITGVFSTK